MRYTSRRIFRAGFAAGFLYVASATGAIAAYPDIPECPGAEPLSYSMRSWKQIHDYYLRYKSWCIDGSLGEGLADSVVQTLYLHWDSLPALAAHVKRDRRFLPWVLNRIQVMSDDSSEEQLAEIILRSRSQCHSGLGSICRQIEDRAVYILHGINSPTLIRLR